MPPCGRAAGARGPGDPGRFQPTNDGFLPIDQHARVKGVEDVYAAGDGDQLPDQAGRARHPAGRRRRRAHRRSLGADLDPQPFHPVLRGMLLTGDESLSLKHSLTGGEGEGKASNDYLWWPPHKVSGRYLCRLALGRDRSRGSRAPGEGARSGGGPAEGMA